MIVVVSGFLGRYLYTQVPELVERRRARGARSRAALPAARGRGSPCAMAEIDRELADAAREGAAGRACRRACSRALWWLIFQDIGRIPRTLRAPRPARAARRRSQDPQASSRGAPRRMIVDRAPPGRRTEGAAAAPLVEEGPRPVHRPPDRVRDRPHLHLVVACSLVTWYGPAMQRVACSRSWSLACVLFVCGTRARRRLLLELAGAARVEPRVARQPEPVQRLPRRRHAASVVEQQVPRLPRPQGPRGRGSTRARASTRRRR